MGTISEKLTYLNGTKQLLKDKINNLGGSIDEQTTFRQYVDQLGGVYDVLPKTSFQEGTDVTIEGGLKGKLDFEDGKVGYGQASQDGEPTPSTPVEVKCVAGRNKFDISTQKTGKVYNRYNKTWDNSGEWNASDYIKVNQNSSYVLSFGSFDSGMQVYVTYLENDKDYISGGTPTTITNLSVPITTPLNCEYIVFGYYNNKNATNIMLEEGTQATPYLPYNTIEIVESGKNLWGLEKRVYSGQAPQSVTATISNGKLTATGTSSAHTAYAISVEIGEKYTIAWKNATGLNSVQVGNGETDIGTQYFRNYNATGLEVITANTNSLYMKILSSGTTLTVDDVMVVKGEYTSQTIGDYEPYHTPITYPISLGSNKFYKIGDYADELLYDVENDKVYKKAYIGKIKLNGSENIAKGTDTDYIRFEVQGVIPLMIKNTGRTECLSNYFHFLQSGRDVGACFTYWIYDGSIFIYPQQTITEVADMKTWLSSNQPIFYYILATPTLTELTDTTLKQQVKDWYYSQSYTGTTIIESNGDLPMIIKVRALKGE